MEDTPLVSISSLKTGIVHCVGCTSMGALEGVKAIAIKTSVEGRHTFVLCKECSEKIALFLIRQWAGQEDRLPAMPHKKSPEEYLLAETETVYSAAIGLQLRIMALLGEMTDPTAHDALNVGADNIGKLLNNIVHAKRAQEKL